MAYEIPNYSEEQVEAAKAKYGAKCLKILEVYPDEDTEQPSLFLIKKPSPSLVYLLSSKEFENNILKLLNLFEIDLNTTKNIINSFLNEEKNITYKCFN
jgi:hypothetical protein